MRTLLLVLVIAIAIAIFGIPVLIGKCIRVGMGNDETDDIHDWEDDMDDEEEQA